MGRHRRTAPTPGPSAPPHEGASGRHRGARPVTVPVRTGLLGASAAVAMGAVAMASGLLPGGENYTIGGGLPEGRVRAGGLPDLRAQGDPSSTPGASRAPGARGTDPATPGRTGSGARRPHSPTDASSPTRDPSGSTAAPSQRPARPGDGGGTGDGGAHPSRTSPAAPGVPTPAATASAAEKAAESAVLTSVNRERAQAGCRPVSADPELTGLARDFSQDMARRDFFDHTDPDGDTPWDRADERGIHGLGGENIARGQGDAKAVMDTWMHSPSHRANILDCDYRTLGVGAHFGDGGPWWTQDFGY